MVLQQAWFRVGAIPADERSIRTLAKVGGLVGKVMEIDEKTRYRADYVRMKIACKDVHRVPKTSEGTLGLYFYDLTFEREVQGVDPVRTLSSGIKITEKGLDPKRFKADEQPKLPQDSGIVTQSRNPNPSAGSSKFVQQHKTTHISNSAPPKMSSDRFEKTRKTHVHLISPNEKAKGVMTQTVDHIMGGGEQADKVHILDTFEDSDAESETLSERLRKIDACDDNNQGNSKEKTSDENQQVWAMEIDENEGDAAQVMKIQKRAHASLGLIGLSVNMPCDETLMTNLNQEEKDVTDEAIINSQESIITDDGQDNSGMVLMDTNPGGSIIAVVQEQGPSNLVERSSERLMKDMLLTTQEKTEAMANSLFGRHELAGWSWC